MITLLHRTTIKASDNCFKWAAQCFCGTLFIVQRNKVVSGHTKSCGCLRKAESAQRMRDVWAGKRGINEKRTK